MRILVAETIDPDGAMVRWASPDLVALGHDVLPLPTQELAPVLGASGLGAWIEALAESFRPDLVIVCPPYDHASAATWSRCRELGAKVVGFAMDEPLFAKARARPAVASTYVAAVRAFDRLYCTAPEAAADLAARGLPARWLRWALSPASLVSTSDATRAIAVAADALSTSAVLVGRPYARRIDLVRELAEHVPVAVFGHGWDAVPSAALGRATTHGPLTGPAMQAVLAAAGVVITTGDWESTPIPMVKIRLLEAAFAGAVQVAQRSADLDAYFPPDELPRFDDVADLAATCRTLLAAPAAARAAAARARERAHREHTWTTRFAELIADLLGPSSSSSTRSPSSTPPAVWRVAIIAAAADAERRQSYRLAAALYAAAHEPMGEARALLPIDPSASAHAARRAIAERDANPAATVGLYARVPTPAPALGHVGFLDPSPELEALLLTALLATSDTRAAHDTLAALVARDDPDRLVAVAAILTPDDVPAHVPLWQSLFSAALAASPADRDLYEQHRDRFAQALSKIGARQRDTRGPGGREANEEATSRSPQE